MQSRSSRSIEPPTIVNPYDQLLAIDKRITTNKTKIITTFSERLNQQFDDGGIEPTNVFMLGANYGTGKTYFAINWMLHSMREGKKVIFFSLDMDFHKILFKIIRNVVGTGKTEAIQLWKTEKEYVKRKLMDAGYFDNLKIYTNEEKPISFKEMTFICEEEKPDLVFIDHFGKVYGWGHNMFAESKITAEYFHRMKMKLDTTFVILIQMRKMDSKHKKMSSIPPFREDYKGAGEIGEDADVMLSLARPDMDSDCDEEKKRMIVGALRKNRLRDEPEDGFLFWRYDPVTTRMTDLMMQR